MADLDTIARIQIEATTDGVEQSTAQLDQLTAAQDRLATQSSATSAATDASATTQTAALGRLAAQSNITAVATDTSAAKQLSAETAYQRLATRIDSTYASSQAYAKGQGVLSAALNQGIIDSATYETRLGQLGAKFGVVNESVAESPGIFRSLTDALGITTPALGASAVASEGAAVAHEHHASAARELREPIHALDPALKELGGSLAGMTQFVGAARGGLELLAVAMAGAFITASAAAAEQVTVTKQRLSEFFDSAKVGTSAFEGLEKQADSLSISVSGLVKPYEQLIQLVGQLQQKQAGSGTVNPATTAAISQNVIDSITNFLKADDVAAADIPKNTSAIVAAMSSRSASVKVLHADMTTTTEKIQEMDAQGFQKFIDLSPGFALAVAKAFNYSSIETFRQHLEETPVSTQKVIDVLNKLPAASKAVFDASRANGATFQDQIGAIGVAWEHMLVTVGNVGGLAAITGLLNNIAAGWDDIFGGKLPEIASKGLDLVSAKISTWVGQATPIFNTLATGIQLEWTEWTTFASDKLDALKNTISAWVTPVAGFFTTLGTGIKLEWTEATTWATDKLAALKSTISEWVSPVIDLFTSIADAIRNTWGAALDYISSKLSWLTGLVSGIGSLIGKLAPNMSGFSNLTSGNVNAAPAGGLPPLTIADVTAAVNGSTVTQNTANTAQAATDTTQAVLNSIDVIRGQSASQMQQAASLNGLTNDQVANAGNDINNASNTNAAGHAKTASAVTAGAQEINTGLSNSTADLSAAISAGFSDISAAMDQTSVAKAGQAIGVGSAPIYATPAGPYVAGGVGYGGPTYPFIVSSDPRNANLPGYEGPQPGISYGAIDPGAAGQAELEQRLKDFQNGVSAVTDPLANAAVATTNAATAANTVTTALNSVATAATAAADALSPLYRSTSGWSGLGLGAASQVLPNPYSTVGVPGPSYKAPGTSISGAANAGTAAAAPATSSTAPLATTPPGGVPPGLTATGYQNSSGQPIYINSAGQAVNAQWTAQPQFYPGNPISGAAAAGTAQQPQFYPGYTVAPGTPGSTASGGGAGVYSSGGGSSGVPMLSFSAASGAEFDVPGSAGSGDSVHLDAWVKPSEHVKVSNPSNDNNRPPPQVTQGGDTYFVTNVQTNDKRSFINSEAQLASQIARMVYAAAARG